MNDNILDTIDLVQLGQRLQKARKRQGLTQAAAARVIDVARTTITAIEKGERRIKADELMKLAEAYARSVSDFVHSGPQVDIAQVQFRSSATITSADETLITQAIDQLVQLCTNYVELEQMMDRPLAQNYPPIYRHDGLPTDQAAEGLAIAERHRLGLGDGPVPILRELLEKQVGLRIFYLPLRPSGKVAEVYFFEPTLGGCIGINELQKSVPERCRWSLAHAYAHFLAHRSKTTVLLQDQYQRKPESERFADAFAGYFLLPTAGLTQRFNMIYQSQGRITPADLLRLANYYGVSFQAIVLRLEEMRLVPAATWDKLNAQGFKVKEAMKKLGLQAHPEPTDTLPARYIEIAVAAYQAVKISEGELAQYLGTDRLEARTIAADFQWSPEIGEAMEQDVRELVAA
jgi:Zn-dependent peptidase ImmA (M78 family)/DNA-binding XRE family transcriptional regulator